MSPPVTHQRNAKLQLTADLSPEPVPWLNVRPDHRRRLRRVPRVPQDDRGQRAHVFVGPPDSGPLPHPRARERKELAD